MYVGLTWFARGTGQVVFSLAYRVLKGQKSMGILQTETYWSISRTEDETDSLEDCERYHLATQRLVG